MSESVLRPITDPPVKLLGVEQVAKILNVSPRTVYRMTDAGRMPKPRHLNSLVRWSSLEIDAWITAGCPQCHPTAKRGAK